MQEKLNDLKNNCLLEVSHWWGFMGGGNSGTIITQDKKLYTYTFHNNLTPILKDNNIPLEYISKGQKLTEEEYQTITKFIENEIVGKTFEFMCIRDSSYSVRGTYNGKKFNVPNNVGFGDEIKLFNKANKLIESLKKGN